MQNSHLYTVTEFLNAVNDAIIADFRVAMVQGEVSEFHVSDNKWVWFTLKDEYSSMSCFMTLWQLRASGASALKDGMEIKAVGFPSIFPRSGRFSFKPEQIEFIGEGALKKQFEAIMKKLEAEGLFAMERKRSLPRFPERVGLITSKGAAAYSDFLKVLCARWSGLEIDFYHVAVQGKDAVENILEAFQYFNALPDAPEVLVLTRGGGSLEDLMAFNDERVARAVYASKIPVLCAVGHERDISIAELAADTRASTPSNAAELLVPDKRDFSRALQKDAKRMEDALFSRIAQHEMILQSNMARLSRFFEIKAARARDLSRQLFSLLVASEEKIAYTKRSLLEKKKLLASFSPQEVLKRGYTMTKDKKGNLIRSAKNIKKGDVLEIVFSDGAIESTAL